MARVNYGIPYKGSKNMIAEWVVSHVPECDTFIDVFAGGCAIESRDRKDLHRKERRICHAKRHPIIAARSSRR